MKSSKACLSWKKSSLTSLTLGFCGSSQTSFQPMSPTLAVLDEAEGCDDRERRPRRVDRAAARVGRSPSASDSASSF